MIMMPVWLRNVLVTLFGVFIIAAVFYLDSRTVDVNDSGPDSITFVSTVDPLCKRMMEVDRALCSIAIDRPPYGEPGGDEAEVIYTPDGRTMVKECLSTSDAETLTQCLLSAAEIPRRTIPVCPYDLQNSLQSCVYLDAYDSPRMWMVKQ